MAMRADQRKLGHLLVKATGDGPMIGVSREEPVGV